MNVVIIEDEPKAELELKEILLSVRPEVNIVAIIASVEEAIQWFRNGEHPNVIFSDIQLSDGTSFDIFRQIKVAAPIIFCTAFDEYMLHAFEANGIAYLLKPIVPVKVAESLRKYDNLRSTLAKSENLYTKQIESLLGLVRPSYQSTLLINVRDKIMPVKTDDIGFFYYNNGVISVCLFNGQQYFFEETMEALEINLNVSVFFRVNRQFIIHRNSIQEIERYFSRKLMVKLKLKVPEEIVVSRVKATAFLEWLAKQP
jgi:two-component system LytT family response regulator